MAGSVIILFARRHCFLIVQQKGQGLKTVGQVQLLADLICNGLRLVYGAVGIDQAFLVVPAQLKNSFGVLFSNISVDITLAGSNELVGACLELGIFF